jgi:hypothetical protein
MKNDCYWFVDAARPVEEQTIQAMCLECHTTNNFGWYWSAKQGYGDYDVFCSICKKPIYLKEDNDQTNSESA